MSELDLSKEIFSSIQQEFSRESRNEHEKDAKESTTKELLQLKKSFAKDYFVKLQKETGSLPGLILAETGTVEDYLTSQGILDAIKDKLLLGSLLKKVLEKETIQKLDAMRDKLHVVKNKNDLKSLESEVLGTSKIVADISPEQKKQEEAQQAEQQKELDTSIKTIVENEKTPKQEKLLAILDKILQYDQSNSVNYNRGGRTSLKQGLDCSGLVVYALHQIGLQQPGEDSRDMFSSVVTKKLISDESKPLSKMIKIQPGDLLFWDSKNPKYKFSTGAIPEIKKDGETHRIHHVAFIKEVNYDLGEITIVESNGRDGVTERKTTIEKEKTAKHKSDLYVGTVNYENLLAYNGKKENVLGNVA